MNALALPTRKDEAFRYSDLDALAPLWPVADEPIFVGDNEEGALTLILDGKADVARTLSINLSANARFDLRILSFAGKFCRVQISVLLADGASFTFGAAQLGGSKQTLEIDTEVTHQGENATSRQVVRSVLAGEATGTYLGRICVTRGSNGTDAEQSVRAMLLDRTATANARPELEIFADDVRCAHGCAVGELDKAGLFYMASRGLPPEEAKKLMLRAFVAEAFTGAPEEDRLLDLALERLGELL